VVVRSEAVFPPGSLLTVQIILYLSFFGLLFFSERMLALFKIANSACKPLGSLCLAPSSYMGSFGPRVWSEQIIGQNFNTLEKSTGCLVRGGIFAAVAELARLDGFAAVAEAPR
jgi:hypothetical protein